MHLASLLLAAGLLLTCSPAIAWNAAGHRLSAAIAWRQMDADTREAASAVLAQHPDYTVWLTRYRSSEPAYAAFLEASTWPDDIKRDSRFFDAEETPTPLLPGFADMGRHRHWHYLDLPVDLPAVKGRGSGELDSRLSVLMQSVQDPKIGGAQRAIALAWLIHLVGDIHQPLHVVSRYDDEGRGDDGGNALWIENPFHPRRSSMTLHAYWDDLPGPPWLRGEPLEAAAGALARLGDNPPHAGTIAQWLNESLALARTVAYEGLNDEVPVLTAAYHERATKTARERIALAGKRLARLLDRLLMK